MPPQSLAEGAIDSTPGTSIRVAHVIGALDYGGVEGIALDLLKRLSAEAIESNVYYIGEELTGRQREFVAAAAKFEHCAYSRRRRAAFIRRLAEAFRRDAVDAVLSYTFGNHAWVSMAARLAGIRLCYVSVQGSPLRDRMSRFKNMTLAHLARPFCAGEIAVSIRIRDELVKGLLLPAARVHIIENACATVEIAERAATARAAREAGPSPVILMVARMADAKDHETLLRACAKLIHTDFPLRLRLAGDGPSRSRHEALCRAQRIEDSVEFLGNRSDVPELLGSSDVAVLATHVEGFGIVLAEAMSAGVPVVATDLPVCREVLDDGRCGLLVPPRDADALAEAIRGLLADPALRNRLTQAARERVTRMYDITLAVEKYAALLKGGGASRRWE